MHDSHAHLTIEPLRSTYLDSIKIFREKGGKYIVNVSYDIESGIEVITQQNKIDRVYPNVVIPGIGIHPNEAGEMKRENLKKHLDMLEELYEKHKDTIKVVGETGLDYYYDTSPEVIENQKWSFQKHCEIAKKYNLPMTVHCREKEGENSCVTDTLKIIEMVGNGSIRACFHSFTGDLSMIDDITSHGFFIGFNGIVTYPKAENVREILRRTPLEKVLIETDCPDLPPQLVRSGKKGSIKYCRPSDVDEIVESVAKTIDESIEKILDVTDKNFRELFLRN